MKIEKRKYKIKDEVIPIRRFSADDVKRIRKRTRTTQGFLANWLGVSKKTIQAWESGRNTPNGTSARLLSLLEDKVIGIDVFLEREEDDESVRR